MLLTPALESDFAAIVDLANLAYRGAGPSASWNIETGILEGQRLNESLLREEIAENPNGSLLAYRETPEGALLGTVRLDPRKNDVWHLSLFMVHPQMQNRQLGRTLLTAAEDFVRERGGKRIHMTVLHVRDTLIAWYLRRGYEATGETEPFPYGDDRFGRPLRDDLYFLVLEKAL